MPTSAKHLWRVAQTDCRSCAGGIHPDVTFRCSRECWSTIRKITLNKINSAFLGSMRSIVQVLQVKETSPFEITKCNECTQQGKCPWQHYDGQQMRKNMKNPLASHFHYQIGVSNYSNNTIWPFLVLCPTKAAIHAHTYVHPYIEATDRQRHTHRCTTSESVTVMGPRYRNEFFPVFFLILKCFHSYEN